MDINKNTQKKENKLLKFSPFIVGGIIGIIISSKGSSLGWLSNINFGVLVVTMLVWGFIEINIHEFGHFVFGKKAKFKLLRYALGCLYWKNENNKIKFQVKIHKGCGGFCEMIPEKEPTKKELVWFIAGGVIFNSISLGILLLLKIFLIQKNSIFMDIVNGAIFINLVFIISNALPIKMENISTDGRVIYSLLRNKPYGKIFMKIMSYDGKIIKGIRPKDIDIDLNDIEYNAKEFGPHINIMLYHEALDKKDYEKLKEIVDHIEKNLKLIPSYAAQEIYNELVYYYSSILLNKEKCEQYYKLAKKELVNDMTPLGRRTIAAYSIFIENNMEKGKKCIEEGLQCIHTQIEKGRALLNEELLKQLAIEIRSEA
ncbi:site-2 protease family protein [Oceanirhabdus sp. W0125-5]|uniref:site-2 protease family protein n=1 Tax=Oceanirhabdus sp. W0125-5 TaxID=2999116 RepID=UPI0022F2D4B5|nr:site-2 protease family protein [Oceanirhabdus sp. W0125-5]WBW96289.1 hypothetical protein OW730_21730 [Oceanirhabdus sp. W0125-5]